MPIGTLDEAQPTWVGGWAFDPDHPEAEIAIHVYVDGQFAGNGETKGYRPDVNAAYGITGNHGFTFGVDIAAFGPGSHKVQAYGIDLDGEGNPALKDTKIVEIQGCAASCSGKVCGDDGCGGSCGSCPAGTSCSGGQCVGGGPVEGPPTGHLDEASPTMIGGWAKDPDWDGPVQVHIYVDGAHLKVLNADQWRPDVGAHAFAWAPPPFGHGAHEVIAYALGVNSAGVPDSQNPGLPGSPKTLQATCKGLESDALGWCQGLPAYWDSRQTDTVFVSNDSVRVGVNKSFGGTAFQLYGPGWDRNLLLEHGGGAMQLSIWGYDPVGGVGWYGNDWCDATWYASEGACTGAGHGSCSAWAHPGGAHATDCVSTKPCGGWTPGAPWNPIQAQGPGCGWASPANDCNEVTWQGSTLYTRLDAPFHFTSTKPAAATPMEQWVTAQSGYAEVKYRLTYNGPGAWCAHPQEVPAIFTAYGMNQHYYYYDGPAAFTGAEVTHKQGASTGFLRYPNRDVYGHGEDYFGYVREGWWGVCDGPQERCVTIASFSPVMNEVALHQNQGAGSGYVTALGYFAVQPGMDLQWTVYLFPYRYDAVVGGKTVRDTIYALAPEAFKQGICSSACGGKQCGGDGCGGSCGQCPEGTQCAADGTCAAGACQPSCAGKLCGADGCGGSCGECGVGFHCIEFVCTVQCIPACLGKQCADNGCGGECGQCDGDLVCTKSGQCLPAEQVPPEQRWQAGGSVGDVVPGADVVGGDAGPGSDVSGSDSGLFPRGGDSGVPRGGEIGGGGESLSPGPDGTCPDGTVLVEDKCLAQGSGEAETVYQEGCAMWPRAGSGAAGMLAAALAAVLVILRRAPARREEVQR